MKKVYNLGPCMVKKRLCHPSCQDKLHCKYVVSLLVSFFCESHILVLVYVREVIKSC